MMNIAIYDATILAWKEKDKYKGNARSGSFTETSHQFTANLFYPCEHTVTGAAMLMCLPIFS
jgi:hypothetical protein